jgi:hypothetical protein
LSLIIFGSPGAFAGPLVSGGGSSEAFWVRSQEYFGLVLKDVQKRMLAVHAISFSEDYKTIHAVINCGGGNFGQYTYQLSENCREDMLVPICRPLRSVALDESQSQLCR